jgi:hypothetical protein
VSFWWYKKEKTGERTWSAIDIPFQLIILILIMSFSTYGFLYLRRYPNVVSWCLPYFLLIIASIGVIGSKLSFNKIVDFEFENFHEHWEIDGKPTGGKASRRQASFWKSGFANCSCFYYWIIWTPAWAKGQPEPEKWLRRLRLYTVIEMAGVIGLIVLIKNTI